MQFFHPDKIVMLTTHHRAGFPIFIEGFVLAIEAFSYSRLAQILVNCLCSLICWCHCILLNRPVIATSPETPIVAGFRIIAFLLWEKYTRPPQISTRGIK